jgi:hypothetical protein
LVVANLREKLAVGKLDAQKVNAERFNAKKLNERMLRRVSSYNQKKLLL